MVDLVNVSKALMEAEYRGFSEAMKFNNTTILAIFVALMIGTMALILWLYFWNDSRKSRFLRFLNNNEARIVKGNINNQKFQKKNKAWHINKARPILLKTLFGIRPLYLIRDDTAIAWEFDKKKKIGLSAESLKNFTDHENIKTVLKLSSKDTKEKMLFLIIGLVMGVVIGIIVGVVF